MPAAEEKAKVYARVLAESALWTMPEPEQALVSVLKRLPERELNVLRRYYLEEQTYEEIARALNLSPAQVRQLLSRLKEKLALKWALKITPERSRAPESAEQGQVLCAVIEVIARSIEVLGDKAKAFRWLRTPVPALGDKPPLSVLHTRRGRAQVKDILGRIEHGVW